MRRVLFISMLLSCLIVIYFINNKARSFSRESKVYKDSISTLNSFNQYLKKNIDFSHKYSRFILGDSILNHCQLMTNEDSKTYINLNSVLESKENTLLLRYTEIGCDMCSDLTIEKLKELKKAIPNTNVLIFVDFTNVESYLLWRKGAKVDFDVFYLRKGSLPMDHDSPTYSYLLKLDNTKKIYETLIPNSGYPSLLANFLNLN